MAEVTLVKPDGSTCMTLDAAENAVKHVVTLDINAVHRAYISSIPESRRGDIDRLRAMGYQEGV